MEALSQVYQTLIDNFVFYIAVLLGLTQFIKDVFALEGKVNMAVSFGVGVFVGGVYFVSYMFPQYSEVIQGVFFMITIGLVASGFYSIGTRLVDGE